MKRVLVVSESIKWKKSRLYKELFYYCYQNTYFIKV